jgi:hypothetical protein
MHVYVHVCRKYNGQQPPGTILKTGAVPGNGRRVLIVEPRSSSNGEITHRAHLAVGSAFFAPAVVRSGEEVAWIIQSWRGSPAVQGAEVLLGKAVTGQCFKVYELSNKVLFTEPVMLACVRKGCVNWVRLNNLVL